MNLDALRKYISLEGKVAIVTGASRLQGQGLATARSLAIRGARIVLTDIARPAPEMELAKLGMGSASQLEAAVAEIEALGAEAIGVPADLTRPEEIEAVVQKAVEVYGGLDILINNAGVFVGSKPMEALTSSDWELSCRVHIKAVADLSLAVIPHMKRRGGGAIVNNASVLGVGAVGGCAAYVASKYGLVGLTKSMADEYGADNIRVNAVCPGNVWTDISEEEARYMGDTYGTPSDVESQQAEPSSPFDRYARPEEVAEAMVFLASPAASFIQGVSLRVDGGLKGLLI